MFEDSGGPLSAHRQHSRKPRLARIIQPSNLRPDFPVTAKAGSIEQNLITPNAQHRYEVREDDLPLSCPMPGMYLWNSHPKVFLPIAETGSTRCPYCGAQYLLVSDGE